jgi:hypothetical protein
MKMSNTVAQEVQFCKYAADNCPVKHSQYMCTKIDINNTTVSDIVFFTIIVCIDIHLQSLNIAFIVGNMHNIIS